MSDLTHYTLDEWFAEGKRLFGEDQMVWRFVCPNCGLVASVADWCDVGAPAGAVAYSCLGRYDTSIPDEEVGTIGNKKQPCDFTEGGLFGMSPVDVDGRRTWAFAPVETQS